MTEKREKSEMNVGKERREMFGKAVAEALRAARTALGRDRINVDELHAMFIGIMSGAVFFSIALREAMAEAQLEEGAVPELGDQILRDVHCMAVDLTGVEDNE